VTALPVGLRTWPGLGSSGLRGRRTTLSDLDGGLAATCDGGRSTNDTTRLGQALRLLVFKW
jgi:hypothetical protein